jgi:hypothetical protein
VQVKISHFVKFYNVHNAGPAAYSGKVVLSAWIIEAPRSRVLGGIRHPRQVSGTALVSIQGLADGGANALTEFNVIKNFN